MKKTSLTDTLIALNGKMIDFEGYNIPLEFSGSIDEITAVKNGVGIFDSSFKGEIWIKGPQALSFLQRVTSDDIDSLAIGKTKPTFIIDKDEAIGKGIIYHYEPEKYMLVTAAIETEQIWEWCANNNKEHVDLENATDKIAQIALLGTKAMDTLQKLTKIDLATIAISSFAIGQLKGSAFDNVIISNTDQDKVEEYEIYCYQQYAQTIWDEILKAGKEFNIKPIGLKAYKEVKK